MTAQLDFESLGLHRDVRSGRHSQGLFDVTNPEGLIDRNVGIVDADRHAFNRNALASRDVNGGSSVKLPGESARCNNQGGSSSSDPESDVVGVIFEASGASIVAKEQAKVGDGQLEGLFVVRGIELSIRSRAGDLLEAEVTGQGLTEEIEAEVLDKNTEVNPGFKVHHEISASIDVGDWEGRYQSLPSVIDGHSDIR